MKIWRFDLWAILLLSVCAIYHATVTISLRGRIEQLEREIGDHKVAGADCGKPTK